MHKNKSISLVLSVIAFFFSKTLHVRAETLPVQDTFAMTTIRPHIEIKETRTLTRFDARQCADDSKKDEFKQVIQTPGTLLRDFQDLHDAHGISESWLNDLMRLAIEHQKHEIMDFLCSFKIMEITTLEYSKLFKYAIEKAKRSENEADIKTLCFFAARPRKCKINSEIVSELFQFQDHAFLRHANAENVHLYNLISLVSRTRVSPETRQKRRGLAADPHYKTCTGNFIVKVANEDRKRAKPKAISSRGSQKRRESGLTVDALREHNIRVPKRKAAALTDVALTQKQPVNTDNESEASKTTSRSAKKVCGGNLVTSQAFEQDLEFDFGDLTAADFAAYANGYEDSIGTWDSNDNL